MTAVTQLAIRLYALTVRLYPCSFRAEFGEEMQVVFVDAVAAAVERGRLSLAAVCLREARDLPSSLLREMVSHLRSRGKEALMSETDQNRCRAEGTGSIPRDSPASWPAAVLLVVLPGFLLGLPLPLAMRIFCNSDSDRVVGWAVNGSVSVVASIAAAGIVLVTGIQALVWIAAGMYSAAAFLVWRRVTGKPPGISSPLPPG